MKFSELIKARYSVREYTDKKVEEQKVQEILDAGRVAPTAANFQPNTFLVLNTTESLSKLRKGCGPHGAPLAVIVCADKGKAWVRPFDKASMLEVDASIAADHMMLQAQELGLGTCWITYFDPAIIRKEFNIPQNLVPINILVIGYAAGEAESADRHSATRKPLSAIVKHNTF